MQGTVAGKNQLRITGSLLTSIVVQRTKCGVLILTTPPYFNEWERSKVVIERDPVV